MNIAIFASGNGSNAEAIIAYGRQTGSYKTKFIVCNRREAGIYDRASRLNIPVVYFSKKELEKNPAELKKRLNDQKIELIVLAGFLCKIPIFFISEFKNKILNIHPSLLPKFGGKGMYGNHVHHAVLIANEHESGITIHLVNEEYDQGEHLLQVKVRIDHNETIDSLATKIQKLEHKMYPQVIEAMTQK